MALLKNNQSDDLTLKYLLQNVGGSDSGTVQQILDLLGSTALPTTAQTVTGAIAELDGDVRGKVSKSGDTMTGDLTISKSDDTPRFIAKNSNIDITGTNLPGSTQYDGIYFRDANDNNIGYCESSQTSTGELYTDLAVRIGSSLTNRLRLGIENGTRTVNVGNAKSAWLDALGLGSTSTTSTESDIISEASGASITSPQYAQWGKVAMLKFTVSRDTATSTTAVAVGTLKTGKRPAIDTNIISSTGRVFGTISASNGQVSIRTPQGASDLPANTSVTIRATYILA